MLLEGLKKERWGHEGGWGVGFVTEVPAKKLRESEELSQWGNR